MAPVELRSGTAGLADGTTLAPVNPVFVPPFLAPTDFEQAIPAKYGTPEMRHVTRGEIRLTALNKP